MLYALSGFVHTATGVGLWKPEYEAEIHRSRVRETELRKSPEAYRKFARR